MTKSVKEVLQRVETNEAQIILDQFANGIDEIVNHGTQIFLWYMSNSNGGDEKLPPAMRLTRFVRNSKISQCICA